MAEVVSFTSNFSLLLIYSWTRKTQFLHWLLYTCVTLVLYMPMNLIESSDTFAWTSKKFSPVEIKTDT